MTTRSTLTVRVTELEQELGRVKADLERLQNFEARIPPTDASMTMGTVVRWRKVFGTGGGGTVYTYAAIKTNVGWFLTGTSTVSMTWDRLVEFMVAKGTLLSLDIATSWDPII